MLKHSKFTCIYSIRGVPDLASHFPYVAIFDRLEVDFSVAEVSRGRRPYYSATPLAIFPGVKRFVVVDLSLFSLNFVSCSRTARIIVIIFCE